MTLHYAFICLRLAPIAITQTPLKKASTLLNTLGPLDEDLNALPVIAPTHLKHIARHLGKKSRILI